MQGILSSRTLMVVVVVATVCANAAPRRPHGTRSLADAEAELRTSGGDAVAHVAEPMDNIVDLTTDYFYRYLKPIRFRHGRERYWLVLFYAKWCGSSCDELHAPLKEIAARLHVREEDEETRMKEQQQMRVRLVNRGRLSLGKHDATLDDGIPAAHGVKDRAYPALVLFDKSDERKVTHFNGDRSAEEIARFIKEHTQGEVDLTTK